MYGFVVANGDYETVFYFGREVYTFAWQKRLEAVAQTSATELKQALFHRPQTDKFHVGTL